MSITPHSRPVDSDFYIRRGRRLRSEAAASAVAWIGGAILAAIQRAYVRPYRMARTPGCGCEA